MEPAEENFLGYSDFGDLGVKKDDFKKRQMSCYVKDLPKDEIPASIKEALEKPTSRRMSCVQMLK